MGLLRKSPARIAASRANGARSRGPASVAGKARSSQNATRHGLLSRHDFTPAPSDPDFDSILTSHLHRFPHADPALLHAVSLCRWRARQARALETEWLDEFIAACPDPSPARSHANAFRSLAATNKYRLLFRYEGRQHRRYDRLLQLLVLQEQSPITEKIKKDETNLEVVDSTIEHPSEHRQKTGERTGFNAEIRPKSCKKAPGRAIPVSPGAPARWGSPPRNRARRDLGPVWAFGAGTAPADFPDRANVRRAQGSGAAEVFGLKRG